MAKLTKYIAITASLFIGCGDSDVSNDISGFNPNITTYGSLTDSRDGKDYRTVEIGDRTWMAENLKYASHESGASWCYGNNASYCATYGRLYDRDAAVSACPSGWHLPTDADWKDLIWTANGSQAAAGKLKSQKGWNNNGNGTDELGFSALPGGYSRSDRRTFIGVGYNSFWWSATGLDAWVMGSDYKGVEVSTLGSQAGLSVRCVQD